MRGACERTIGSRVGFMQGRLSPCVEGRIQAFPWVHWRVEFAAAQRIGLEIMEWTLDQDRIRENPLMTRAGREEIDGLCADSGVKVPSLTGDFIMQAPFYKAEGPERRDRLDILRAVIEACANLDVRLIVFPLVDGGRLDDPKDAAVLREGLETLVPEMTAGRIVLAFESDFAPTELAAFIAEYPAEHFALNYDMGNSASLGYDPAEEFAAYGHRIANVHVKDRRRGGSTVPLRTGSADLPQIFRLLRRMSYRGNLILQTARATNGDDVGTLAHYRDMACAWWDEAA